MPQPSAIAIIGAGVIGCAIAYELSKNSNCEIFVIERNKKVKADNQSSRNSGVIHAGIYYPKNKAPLKAEFCVKGNKLMYDFCMEFNVPHKNTGKLVVATNGREEEYLEDVLKTALENGVAGIRKITCEEAKELEPNVRAKSAIYLPSTGIVEATELVSRMHSLAVANKVFFVTGNEVVDVKANGKGFLVTTKSGELTETFETKILINAAGLYSDNIARMVNHDSPYEVCPMRGEYAKFYKTRRKEIDMTGLNVYPVPHGVWNNGDKADIPLVDFKRLFGKGEISKTTGVHLTPTFETDGREYFVGDTVIVGPYYFRIRDREDYTPQKSEHDFLTRVKDFFPGLRLEDLQLHQTGINAKIKGAYDFIIEPDEKHPNCINLLNIDSPGLTSSLAIAKYVRELIENL